MQSALLQCLLTASILLSFCCLPTTPKMVPPLMTSANFFALSVLNTFSNSDVTPLDQAAFLVFMRTSAFVTAFKNTLSLGPSLFSTFNSLFDLFSTFSSFSSHSYCHFFAIFSKEVIFHELISSPAYSTTTLAFVFDLL